MGESDAIKIRIGKLLIEIDILRDVLSLGVFVGKSIFYEGSIVFGIDLLLLIIRVYIET